MTKKSKLFGTDGIRQQVGRFPLDDHSIVKLGGAIGTLIHGSKIIIGRDTRESGAHIEELIAAGISGISRQCHITRVGVIPTPGLSFITQHNDFDYGIMITASHNPYTDNGIKIFGSDGEKIPEKMESQIEDIFNCRRNMQMPGEKSWDENKVLQYSNTEGMASPTYNCSRNTQIPGGKFWDENKVLQYSNTEMYRHFLSTHASDLGAGLKGKPLKIVLDCANGATYEMAPLIFREAGLEPVVIHAEPDGKNINRECGSTHIESLRETVISQNANLGIAFDGDGDRVLFVDNNGHLLDGDYTLFMLSQYYLHTRTHKDFNKIVVGTVMGNLGLEKSLEKLGITYLRTQVGDKNVYREMMCHQSILGGEQSGHTILRSFQKTGDGILTALYFLKALDHLGIKPGELFEQLRLYPQVNKNIKIREKKDLDQWDQLNEMISAFNTRYGDNSRLLIRYSGTEPKIRLMMESEHQIIVDENIGKFEHLIKSTIGEGD